MHPDGFVILLIPLVTLSAICRGGKWHWNVIEQMTGQVSPWTRAVNALFWFGWFTGLIFGTLRICGVV